MLSWLSALMNKIRQHPYRSATLVALLTAGAWYVGWYARSWLCLRQAEQLVQTRDFDDAETAVAQALTAWPASADAHLLAARIARLRKEPLEAYRRLEQSLARGADVERVVLERYLLRAGRGELVQVEKLLLAFLQKGHRDSLFVLDALTFEWMMTHRLGEASNYLDQWLKHEPDNREALLRRAWTLERLRNMPEAIAAYEQALQLDPARDRKEADRVRLLLGQLLLERFRAQEALPHFETLYERQPSQGAIVLGLARCRLLLGETEAGVRLLEGLLTADPTNGPAMGEMGKALLTLERFPEAAVWLRKAFQALPTNRQIVFNLEQCLHKLGRTEETKQLRDRLGRIRDDERLMAELMTETQYAPTDPSLRQRIGEVFLRNGLVGDGLLWLRSALIYEADYAPAHEVLAEWWESRNDDEQAAPHRQALARLGVPKKSDNRFRQ
jgi:tetratricopeptide (TPR) repeat protein